MVPALSPNCGKYGAGPWSWSNGTKDLRPMTTAISVSPAVAFTVTLSPFWFVQRFSILDAYCIGVPVVWNVARPAPTTTTPLALLTVMLVAVDARTAKVPLLFALAKLEIVRALPTRALAACAVMLAVL